MEKIKLSQFGLIDALQPVIVPINGVDIEVMPLLPYEKILEMINEAMAIIIDDRPFISRPLYHIVKDLLIIKYYTNIAITVFDGEYLLPNVVYETYDLVKQFGIFDAIVAQINAEQLSFFNETLEATLESVVAYKNSAKGLIDNLADNAATTTSEMDAAMKILNDPEQLDKAKKLIDVYAAQQ